MDDIPARNPPSALARVRRAVGKRRECYPAAEVVYHANGGRRAGYTPVQQRHEGRSHWWVRGPAGEVLDPAVAQFRRPVPYERGRGRGFLTKKPSRRARALAKRARVKLNPPARWEEWQQSIPEAEWLRIWGRSAEDRRGALLELRRLYWRWLASGRDMTPRLFGEPELPPPPPPRRRRRRGPHDWELGQNPAAGDARLRELERAWRAGDGAAADPLFRSLLRADSWDPLENPSLFWHLLEDPEHGLANVQLMLDHARAHPDTSTPWERNPNSYVFLRAFRMGYRGRVEARYEDDLGVRRPRRFHVAASPRAIRAPDPRRPTRLLTLRGVEALEVGGIPLPGSSPLAFLVESAGPTVKRYAGRIIKSPGTPLWGSEDSYVSARIMQGTPSRVRRGTHETTRWRWKNNPDEAERRSERAAAAGDVEASARVIAGKVRRGEIPMANVELASVLAGRKDARLVCGSFALGPQQYLPADRRDLVRWALRLDRYLPLADALRAQLSEPIRRRERDQLIAWVQGETNRKPGGTAMRMPTSGPGSVYADALRLCRARSNRTLHGLVLRVVRNYQIRVWQIFIDEVHGHHGSRRESPAWSYEGVKADDHGNVSYDPLTIRSESRRQARDLLGRMLLHEA